MVGETEDVQKLPPLTFTYEPTEYAPAQREAAKMVEAALTLWLARPAVPADDGRCENEEGR